MSKINNIFSLVVLVLFFVSCSENNDGIKSEEHVPLDFTGLSVSEGVTFIDDPVVVLEVEGSGFSVLEVVSDQPDDVVINEVSETYYEVSSTKEVDAEISVKMQGEDGIGDPFTRTVIIEFYEHGVKVEEGDEVEGTSAFNSIEGVTVSKDETVKVLDLLGEPEEVGYLDANTDFWTYLSKGIELKVNRSTGFVISATAYSEKDTLVVDGEKKPYTNYPYDLPNEWKIQETLMDEVVAEWGEPAKGVKVVDTATNMVTYEFKDQNTFVRFQGDVEEDDEDVLRDDFEGKIVQSMLIE